MNTVKNILVCAGLALLATSCSSNMSPPKAGSSQSSSSLPPSMNSSERAVAERVFSLVNAERSRAGKRPLTGNRGLISIAQKNSNRLAGGHVETNQMAKESRSQYAYLKHSVENMNELTMKVPASNSDPAAKAVAQWSRQRAGGQSHLTRGWHVVGIGVKKTSAATYITLCLGSQPSGVPRSVRPVGW